MSHIEIDKLVCNAYGTLPSVASRFNNGKPGIDWIKAFCKRQKLAFNVPSKQTAECSCIINTTVLTTNFLNLEDIPRELDIDAISLFNLEENHARYCNRTRKRKGMVQKWQRCHLKCADLDIVNRVTVTSTVSAVGHAVLAYEFLKEEVALQSTHPIGRNYYQRIC